MPSPDIRRRLNGFDLFVLAVMAVWGYVLFDLVREAVEFGTVTLRAVDGPRGSKIYDVHPWPRGWARYLGCGWWIVAGVRYFQGNIRGRPARTELDFLLNLGLIPAALLAVFASIFANLKETLFLVGVFGVMGFLGAGFELVSRRFGKWWGVAFVCVTQLSIMYCAVALS